MKNFVKVLCFTLSFIVVIGVSLFGYLEWYKTDFDFIETTDSDAVMITGYNGTDKDVKIPSKIRGKSVTKIDGLAFENSDITSIDIGDSITYIGKSTFRGCKALKSVKLGKSLKNIDEGCFNDCVELESIILPESLEVLGQNIFSGCSSLTEVKLESDESFTIRDDIVFSSDMKTLVFALPYAKLGNYTCPDSVTKINESAFSGCESLTGFTFSKNMTVVPRGIFINCTALKEVSVPDNIAKISSLITTGSGITRITIPSSVKEIDSLAFYDNEKDIAASKNVTIVTVKGSVAQSFAEKNEMKLEYIK